MSARCNIQVVLGTDDFGRDMVAADRVSIWVRCESSALELHDPLDAASQHAADRDDANACWGGRR